MPKVFFATIGCKMNQIDTEQMREKCVNAGIDVVDTIADAEIAVINSCAVTKGAEKDVRRQVRKAADGKRNIIVAGCITDEYANFLKDQFGVKAFLFNGALRMITDAVEQVLDGNRFKWKAPSNMTGIGISGMSEHTRGFVKIEEGCSHRCSYCIIPMVRGSQVTSRPLNMLIDDVKRLVLNGYKEIVISGTDIGSYGKDTGSSLHTLLSYLTAIDGDFRIRISSIDAIDIDDTLIGILKNHKICRHLHISLQSGSDRILKLMRRPYNTGTYREKIENLVDNIPDIALGTDIIVGFPGEDECEFQKTEKFVQSIPFVFLHPFSYSPREGTESYSLKYDKYSQKERIKELKDIVYEKNHRYRRQFLGKTVKILAERDNAGKTEYYFPVHVGNANLQRGKFYCVAVKSVSNDKTEAIIDA